MNTRKPCEFSLIRYVPDPVRNEFINIGVLLCDDGQRVEVRFTRNWQQVRSLDPNADTAMLEALEAEIQRRLLEAEPVLPIRKVLEDSFSNAIQMTESKACLAESFPAELERLMEMYVEPPRSQREGRATGRTRIHQAMRSQFERAGVWELMRKRIAAAEYTRPGDSLRIDCGYRPNGIIRMFHAVSLQGEGELAKILAFSAPRLREGVVRVEKAKLELTAVIEPLAELKGLLQDQDRLAQYRFAIETMEQGEIRVLTTHDLPAVAETARRELHVE